MAAVTVVRIGSGAYRVEHDDRQDTVYVAGDAGNQWAFWNGHLFQQLAAPESPSPGEKRAGRVAVAQSLTAPMPATVIKVLVAPGAAVKKGDTVLLLEAMKMELPVRAPADGTITAVNCREGDLVQPEQVLVILQ